MLELYPSEKITQTERIAGGSAGLQEDWIRGWRYAGGFCHLLVPVKLHYRYSCCGVADVSGIVGRTGMDGDGVSSRRK